MTPREKISGQLTGNEAQAAEATTTPVVESNPFRRRIAELEKRPGHSPQDRAANQRLIKRFTALAAEYESKERESENVQRHSERDDVQRLRSHARRALAEAETPEEKARAQSLHNLSLQPYISRGAYWDAVRDSGGVVVLNDDDTAKPAISS